MTATGNLNANLHKAARNKNDDFYTQLSDIAEGLRHYAPHFKDKVVYCNCDDPKASQFFQYFYKKFRSLGLQKLITTCYKNQNPDLFSLYDQERAIGITLTEFAQDDDMPNIEIFDLDGDGDFRSEESIQFLKQADIVVTNPPFSLFREYVAQLIKYEKQFLIIGNKNAITYKELFSLIKDNRVWLGHGFQNGNAFFQIKDVDRYAGKPYFDHSTSLVKFRNVAWFTNLDHKKRHEELILGRKYTPEDYPKYDNYDAINVNKVADIPEDYPGAMGVPITFLDKYNPEQFEIVGMDHDVKDGLLPHIVNPEWTGKFDRGYVGGKRLYSRILIRNKQLQS